MGTPNRQRSGGKASGASDEGGMPWVSVIPLSPDRPIRVAVGERVPPRLSPAQVRLARRAGAEMHLALELGVVVEGFLRQNNGAGWFRVGPGQVWACASFQLHRMRYPSRYLASVFFQTLPSLLRQMPHLQGFDPMAVFRSPARFGPIGAGARARRELRMLGKELADRYGRRSAARQLPGPACVDLQRLLLLVFEELHGRDAGAPKPSAGSSLALRIDPALELLEAAHPRRIPVAEAARACHMTPRTFRRHFTQFAGLAFSQFELRFRLARGAQALRSSARPIKAIAYELGFANKSHFSQAFAAHYGVPPSTYRRALLSHD